MGVRERIGRLGERATTLAPGDGHASYVLDALPRGRYAFEDSRAEIEDPFGLERVEQPLSSPGALLVYPRLVELERLFSGRARAPTTGGGCSATARRVRPAQRARDEQGESLRKVHWPSTAQARRS